MTTLTKPAPGDAEYRTLLGHTTACSACCRKPCATAISLNRAWREARR